MTKEEIQAMIDAAVTAARAAGLHQCGELPRVGQGDGAESR